MFNIFGTTKVDEPTKEATSIPETRKSVAASLGETIATRATKVMAALLNSTADTAYDEKYNKYRNTSDLVYACTSFIADYFGQVRFTVGTRDDNGKVTPHKDKALRELFLNAPNPRQTWTEVLSQDVLSLMLSGNSYLSFEKSKGKLELWNILPPQQMVPTIDEKTGQIKNYKLGDNIQYKLDQIVHTKLPSTTNFHSGESILQPLLDQLTLESYASEDLIQFYGNSSIGSSVLSSDSPLTPRQADDLTTKIENSYSMGSKNRHKMFILPHNLKPTPLKLSPKDSLLLDSLNITEDRILQLFKLHKSVLGGSARNITYTHNMKELQEMIFNNAVRPYVNRFKETLESFLQRVYKDPSLVLIVDYTNIPEINRAVLAHAEVARSLNAAGICSLNESRALLSLEPLQAEYANNHFVPQHLVGSNFVTIEDLNADLINSIRTANTVDDTTSKSDNPEGGKVDTKDSADTQPTKSNNK